MFFKNKKLIGLDIGTSAIKLAEMDITRKGPSLVSFGYIFTPPGAVTSGEINDSSSLSHAIRSLIAEVKTKRRNVALGMWGTAVIIKKISIPQMDENLVAEQMKWEAEQYIPFDINEISLGFHILRNKASAMDTMEILLVAAKQDLVFQYAEAVELADLSCSVVDVCGFALANCFEANYGVHSDTIALLNIGAGVTNFVVLEKGEVIFSRDIPVGGGNYTSEIHKEMGVSLDEAEALKISAASKGEVPDEVHSVISATNEVVAEEIQNSYDFFAATASGAGVAKTFYTGGGSSVPGLIGQLEGAVNIPFELFDPFHQVAANGKLFPPAYINQIRTVSAISMGLALRQVGEK